MISPLLCSIPQAVDRDAENQAAVGRFARYLIVRGYSADTQRLYVGAARRWLAAGGVPGHIDGPALVAWLHKRRLGAAAATVNMDINGLRAFYRFGVVFYDVPEAELAKIPRLRKLPLRLPRWLTDAEVGAVLGHLPLDTFLGLRDFALIMTLYVAGLRAGEAVRMQVSHLVSDGELFVEGKGGHHRYVPLGEQLAGVLDGYLHARAALLPGKTQAMWLTSTGRPLRNGRSIWEIVSRRLWQGLGVEGGMVRLSRGGRPWQGHYPHELRASFATALQQGGCPLPAIAQLMGHKRLETTAHYLGVDIEHLRKTIAKHPRGLRQNGMSSSAKSSTGADDADG